MVRRDTPRWLTTTVVHADAREIAHLKRDVEDRVYARYGTPCEHSRSLSDYASTQYIKSLLTDQVLIGVRKSGYWCGVVAGHGGGDGKLFIHSLYCRVSGRGLGRALLGGIVDAFPEARTCCAEVFDRNVAALGFLQHHGFVLTGASRPSASYRGRRLLAVRADRPTVLRSLERGD